MTGKIQRLPLNQNPTILGRGDLTTDAWGLTKVSIAYSLLHGVFTYNVPVGVWKELLDGVEQPAADLASSIDGKLSLASAGLGVDVTLATLRHPRYEANRGHLYNASVFLPNPDAQATRRWGLFTAETGVFFELTDGELFACRRTTITGVTSTIREAIVQLPATFDAAKGNTYDIQMQWRGVGNILFFVGSPTTGTPVLVHVMRILGTSTQLSSFNPAVPIAFSCINGGDTVTLEAGCVDVSTEGGTSFDGTFGAIAISANAGSVAVSGFNPLVLAVRLPLTYKGRINTRDIMNLAAAAYSDQKSVLRVWVTRDATAISDGSQVWQEYGDGHIEYLEVDPGAVTPASVNVLATRLLYGVRIAQDATLVADAVFSKAATSWLTPGDILIFTVHRENGGAANVGVTYEFSEEV